MKINYKSTFLELLDFLGMVRETPVQQDMHVKIYDRYCKHMSRVQQEAMNENIARVLHKIMDKPTTPVPFNITKVEWENTFV